MPIFEMDPEIWKTLNRLLDHALDLAPEERWKWLEALPPEQEALKPRLAELLERAEREGESAPLQTLPKLAAAVADTAPAAGETTGRPGDQVGPYRLERLLGEGGMGEVWLARRTDGFFERSVALKLPRGLRSPPELRHRMAREREILASLDDPHIARIYDAGLTDAGQPFLALEYIEGRPIDVYVQDRKLDIRSRLELFLQVAAAIAHAHAHLVVHRDLKPSNILVTEEAQVRLLDFGIAKLLEDGQAEETELTRVSGRVLTLAYASPEQVEGQSIGVASDIYSLGVVLYEILSGFRPYKPARDSRGALEDAILHSDPRPPSELAFDAATQKVLRGDLDTIVLKALKKNPRERYTNVDAFADDVERYLEGHPVLAQPDSAAYRAGKFVRRHRAAVLAAGLGLVLLLGFTGTSILQARRIAAERDRATVEEANARRMLDLVVDMFEITDPTLGPGGETLAVAEFLEGAREKIAALRPQPDLQARMEHVLGRIYLARHRYGEARELFEHALDLYRTASEPDEVFALDLEIDLARALEQSSDLRGAEQRLREILPRLRRVRGESDPLVTQTLVRLGWIVGGQEGEALTEQALSLERRRDPPNPIELGRALQGLALQRNRAGDRAAAEKLIREAAEVWIRELGEEHPYSQAALSILTGVLDDIDEQIALYHRLIAMGRRVIGPDTAPVGNRLNGLGVLLRNHGRFDEAEAALTEAVRIWRVVGGDDHWRTAETRRNLASVYEYQSRHDEALALTRDALSAARRSTGSDPRVLGRVVTQWASLLHHSGRGDEALEAAREAVELLDSPAGRAPDLASAQLVLGQVLLQQGSHAEAETPLYEALAQREKLLGPEDPQTGEAQCALGRALTGLGRNAEATALLRKGLGSMRGWPLAHAAGVEACRRALESSRSSTGAQGGSPSESSDR